MLTSPGSPGPEPGPAGPVPPASRRSDPIAASLAFLLALADLVAGGNGLLGLIGLLDTVTALPRAAFVVPVLMLLRELIAERDSSRSLSLALLGLTLASAAWSLSDGAFGLTTVNVRSRPLPPLPVAFFLLLLLTRFVSGAFSIAVAILLFARPELGGLLLAFGVCCLLAGLAYVTVLEGGLGPFPEAVGAILLAVRFLRRTVVALR